MVSRKLAFQCQFLPPNPSPTDLYRETVDSNRGIVCEKVKVPQKEEKQGENHLQRRLRRRSQHFCRGKAVCTLSTYDLSSRAFSWQGRAPNQPLPLALLPYLTPSPSSSSSSPSWIPGSSREGNEKLILRLNACTKEGASERDRE